MLNTVQITQDKVTEWVTTPKLQAAEILVLDLFSLRAELYGVSD
jgi:hypothetical protein